MASDEAAGVPEGYARLSLPPSEYLGRNGPFYARRDGAEVAIGMRIEPRHANAMGIAHGGLVMTLADVVLTVGSNLRAGLSRFLTTVNVSCDFVGPARLGAWIEGRIEVIRTTKTLVFSRTLLQEQDGSPIARVSGILLMRGEPDPRFSAARYFGTE
jgi:uncharacterized protein (TIGR00369 family)